MVYEIRIDESPKGKKRISGLTFFMIITPDERPIYRTMRRKCKDAVMAWEDLYDKDWGDGIKAGYSVFKCWGNGIEANEKVKYQESWTEEDIYFPKFYEALLEK